MGHSERLSLLASFGVLIQITASNLWASPYSVTEGLAEGVAEDFTVPTGDLGGSTLQKIGTVKRVWLPVTTNSLCDGGGEEVWLEI